MELLWYGLIIFASLFIGGFLHKVAYDEVKVGRKWFHVLLALLLGVMVVYFAWQVDYSAAKVLLLIGGIFVGVFFTEVFLYFGILLTSFVDVMGASLFFLYGMVDGTILYYYGRFDWKMLLKKALFFFLPMGLFMFPSALEFLVPIAIGALLPHIVLQMRVSRA